MLEKIGLPAKPSMRGGSWVVDASHCQGCSSQFTFINRKHHCRRCGGLFCNSCTNQRMVLRGQGDSPVRICDPCKKLEDAARFELRHGNRNKAAKGTSKQAQNQEEDILQQIIGTDAKLESHTDIISDLLRTSSTASSSSNVKEEPDIDFGSNSPEKIRQQALEEKNKYKILKGQGKSDEALQAFKRSKELERQAGALELALRKNRRMASKASNLPSIKKDDFEESFGDQKKIMPQKGKEGKNDLAAELRELGWSDADLHEPEKKKANLSLEGELSNLIKEIPKSSASIKASSADKSQVVALKKKALLLKREGKLAEAKEELKKAKILEKQIEEQELLGEDEESDDELSALINSMDNEKHDDRLLNDVQIPNINFDRFMNVGEDITFDANFDVTDNDMNDPELATALKSFGWNEEDDEQDSYPVDRVALQHEVLTLKREALIQKREGNIAKATTLLKQAKLLEKDLETMQVDMQTFNEDNITKMPVKSKLEIQKELLALKKKALALRREGRAEEADEELKKGKALEQQLEDIDIAPNRHISKLTTKNTDIYMDLNIEKDEVEAEVTDQDMHDPAMISVLKNFGWNDDEQESEPASMKIPGKINEIPSKLPRKSKAEIQRELLGLKRKALALRRQGKTEEADEELEKARVLEEQITDMEASSNVKPYVVELHNSEPSVPQNNFENSPQVNPFKQHDQGTDTKSNNTSVQQNIVNASAASVESSSPEQTQKEKALAHKRKALALKRDGKLTEAREELRQAKLLENSLDVVNHSDKSEAANAAATTTEETNQQVQKKPLSSRDRFKMQQQSLAHKRNALKLRREGKIEESDAELELAKALESQLEESSPQESKVEEIDDVGVGDLLDPQLMSALKSIGWQDSDINAQPSTKIDTKINVDQGDSSHLEEMIKVEKVKALNLKREGKQAEALEALRSAKRMEKKLASLT